MLGKIGSWVGNISIIMNIQFPSGGWVRFFAGSSGAGQSVSPRNLAQPPPDQIQVTWIGHSTFLIQLDGRNILTDPIFGNCGPIPSSRLRRLAQPGVALADLPPIHDVLISHNHYDHLDAPTIGQLGGEPHFWLPSGLSPWFQKRDIWRCRELAWWQSQPLAQHS